MSTTTDTSAEPKPPFFAVFDEMGYYMANSNDDVKEALRELPGVPNAQYLVEGKKVFVFEKLVQLVSVSGRGADGRPDAALVAGLLPQAC